MGHKFFNLNVNYDVNFLYLFADLKMYLNYIRDETVKGLCLVSTKSNIKLNMTDFTIFQHYFIGNLQH